VAARRTPDLRSLERLEVFHNHERVGALTRTARGARFEYEQAFFEAHRTREGGLVSSLPFRNRVVEVSGVNLPTYFAGLLPEGLRLRSLVQRLKTSEDDLFSLLAATGSDAVGDVFAVVPGERPTLDLEPEAHVALDQVSFDDLFRRSLDVGAEPTVPGVQEKLSPSVISFPFATRGRRFLLKLDPPDKPGLVRNEHFFMSMAQACGLRVARTSLVTDATGAPGLLVERFDRRRVGRRWVGVHQEDACQLLDRYPADKYRVSVNDLADAFERSAAAPIVEIARLLEVVAFSAIIGNGDLHAKNVSLGGSPQPTQLTPAYDLLSTRPYGDLKLALMMDGRNDRLTRRTFVEFARRYRVRPAAIESRLDALCSSARPFIGQLGVLGLEPRRQRQLEVMMRTRIEALEGS
jgi:serine/threonine-protein kinase HipA